MMAPWMLLAHALTLLLAPVFLIGLINRTQALWTGRKGPRLDQLFLDLRRLLRKTPVYSETSTWIFQLAPWVVLTTTLVAALIAPIVPGFAPISFPYDFVYFAYLLGLGRVFAILAALDTGSSFEGMGASREAAYSALIEPALFFAVGTLALASGHGSLQELMHSGTEGSFGILARFGIFLALLVLLQIEAARVPADDPRTHLELTMIHEVMILDHSGPELAAVQYGAALKLTVIAGLVAALVNPVSAVENPGLSWALSIAILGAVAVLLGLVESLIARLRLRAVPRYAAAGVAAAILSLALTLWEQGALS